MLAISSPAFSHGGPIPRAHTCDGMDISPPLAWTGVPDGARELALVMDDPDAPGGTWVHWVLYKLNVGTSGLPSGVPTDAELAKPVAARQGVNDFRRSGYGGPCPPRGPAHRYSIRLYALDDELSLPAGATAAILTDAMRDHVMAQAEIVGTYARA